MRISLAKVPMIATASGSRLSSAMPRPSNTNPSMLLPLAALAPSAPARMNPARNPFDSAGPSAQPTIVARPCPFSATGRSSRAPQ